jgi:hypothetical protein
MIQACVLDEFEASEQNQRIFQRENMIELKDQSALILLAQMMPAPKTFESTKPSAIAAHPIAAS